MKRLRCSPYAKHLLPEGFSYPQGYLDFVNGGDVPDHFTWSFTNDEYDQAAHSWKMKQHWGAEGWRYMGEIDPIPFARNGDLAAFFDGNDHSGNPEIVVADLGNKNGSYRLKDFDTWWAREVGDPRERQFD